MLAGTNPENFIEMTEISGVHILGGHFSDSHTVTNPTELTTGIKAYDSRFYVWQYDAQASRFAGLHYGIYATVSNTEIYMEVKDSEFIGNFKGLYISGMEGTWVTSNYLI